MRVIIHEGTITPPLIPSRSGRGSIKEIKMSLFDVLLALGILAGAGWLFYRSFIRKKGPCAGCARCSCTRDDHKGNDRLVRLS